MLNSGSVLVMIHPSPRGSSVVIPESDWDNNNSELECLACVEEEEGQNDITGEGWVLGTLPVQLPIHESGVLKGLLNLEKAIKEYPFEQLFEALLICGIQYGLQYAHEHPESVGVMLKVKTS